MNLNKNIFREYDIRGIYPSELNETVAYYVGLAYGTRLKEKGKDTTVLGYDNRVSSMSLANYMANGLLDAGVNVKNIGLVTTPMCYFAANYLYVNASMMITASHNPKEYNGFKFYLSHYPTITTTLITCKDLLSQNLINLYGHTHQKNNFYKDNLFMYHVGLDSHDNKLISIDEIIKEIKMNFIKN